MSVVSPVFQDSPFFLRVHEAKPLFWTRWVQGVCAARGCTSLKAQPVLALQCVTNPLLSRGANLPCLDIPTPGRSTGTLHAGHSFSLFYRKGREYREQHYCQTRRIDLVPYCRLQNLKSKSSPPRSMQ